MDSPGLTPYFVFILVPILLWLLVVAVTRKWKGKRVFAIISGSDNRLSLSRLQAFAWTMVLFGAYAAAMVGHLPITPTTAGDQAAAQKAHDIAAAAVKTAEETVTQGRTDVANAAVGDASAKSLAEDVLHEAERKLNLRKDEERRAHQLLVHISWVIIPSTLLALAGISLATGVFASAISAGGDNGPPPSPQYVSGQLAAAVNPLQTDPKSKIPAGSYWLLIEGTHFGSGGQVRLDGRPARQLFWGDGAIGLDLDQTPLPKRLTIDAPAGKTTYLLSYVNPGAPGTVSLGIEVSHFELADLIRDDTNPRVLALNKFQMLGWTIVAITLFIVIVWSQLGSGVLDRLPEVDSTLVALTGLSQLGYLGGKIVNNSKP
jgi:hypothetical protein